MNYLNKTFEKNANLLIEPTFKPGSSPSDVLSHYGKQGFIDIDAATGTGSTILVNRGASRVVKINYDDAYDVFVGYVKTSPNEHFVEIYSHEHYVGIDDIKFSVVEMELLSPLLPEEQECVEEWVNHVLETAGDDSLLALLPDGLGINEAFKEVLEVAREKIVNLDILKLNNYMIRRHPSGDKYVFIDPFN